MNYRRKLRTWKVEKCFSISLNDQTFSHHTVNDKRAYRWSCIAKNSAGEARKTFDLKVLVPASINELTSSDALITVIPQAPVSIVCDVEGDPTPQVRFREQLLKNPTIREIISFFAKLTQ